MNRMRPLGVACLIVLSLAGVACGLSASARELLSRFSPLSSEVGSALSAAGNPLTVKFNTDALSNASQVIGSAGGTLRATGPDGTRFTLDVPPGALDQDAAISMTPVKTVDGLPLSGGLVGAVQLAPDGLAFSTPVTLTIETKNAASAPGFTTVSFMAQRDGREFHLYPSRVEKNRITIRLAHFSGLGSGKATEQDIATQKDTHSPTGAVARLSQEIVQAAAMDSVRSQIKQAYLEMEKRLDNAHTDADLRIAQSDFIEWWMEVEELGLSEEFQDDINLALSLYAQRIRQLVEQLSQDCINQRDASHLGTLRRWNSVAHRAPASKWIDARTLQDLDARVRKCASFGPWVTIYYRFGVQEPDARYFSRGQTTYNGPLTFSLGKSRDPSTFSELHRTEWAAVGNEDYGDVNCGGDPECQHYSFCKSSWAGAWHTQASINVAEVNKDGTIVLEIYLSSERLSHTVGCPHDGPTNDYPVDPQPTIRIEVPLTDDPIVVEWQDPWNLPYLKQSATIRID